MPGSLLSRSRDGQRCGPVRVIKRRTTDEASNCTVSGQLSSMTVDEQQLFEFSGYGIKCD